MKILRCPPTDRVLVVISEAEGVTDSDIGTTLYNSPATRELVNLDECIGVVPLGSPSQRPEGFSRSTTLLFETPPIMWFQKYDRVWEWPPA